MNVAGRLLTLLLGLLLLVVVARMGPRVQGALALFIALDALLVATASGLGVALAREAGGGSWARARLRPRLLGALAAGALAAVVLALLAQLAQLGEAPGDALRDAPRDAPIYQGLWLLALGAPLLLLGPTVQGLWLGQGRLLALNAAQAASPALVLFILLMLLVMGNEGNEGNALIQQISTNTGSTTGTGALAPMAVVAAWVAARAIVGLGCALLAWRAAPSAVTVVAASPLPPGWRFLLGVAASNVLAILNVRATLFLVEQHAGLAAAGVYSVAVQVAELLWVLSAAVSVSAYHALRAGDPAAAAGLALRAVRWGMGLALLAAPVVGALAWWALPAVLGPDYEAARLPLLLLLPGVVAYAAASGLSAFHTQALGRPQWAARVAAASLLLTLLLAAWAVPRWGAVGAAAATSLAYMLTMAVALPGFLRSQGWGWRQLLGTELG